jgi:hypothetical protein
MSPRRLCGKWCGTHASEKVRAAGHLDAVGSLGGMRAALPSAPAAATPPPSSRRSPGQRAGIGWFQIGDGMAIQLLVRDHHPVIAAAVEGDVDRVSERSHRRVPSSTMSEGHALRGTVIQPRASAPIHPMDPPSRETRGNGEAPHQVPCAALRYPLGRGGESACYLVAVAGVSGTTARLLIFHSCTPRRRTTR